MRLGFEFGMGAGWMNLTEKSPERNWGFLGAHTARSAEVLVAGPEKSRKWMMSGQDLSGMLLVDAASDADPLEIPQRESLRTV